MLGKFFKKFVVSVVLMMSLAGLVTPAYAQADDQNSDGFIVGEGDALRVNVWREPEMSQNVVVRPDGKISLPLIGDMEVTGLSLQKIQQSLETKLKDYLANPRVTVTVTEVRSKKVYLVGEAARPGTYPLLAPTSVLQLIMQAGGLSPYAKKTRIYVLRASGNKQVKLPFNYKEVIQGHNPQQNIQLQSGDMVVVP